MMQHKFFVLNIKIISDKIINSESYKNLFTGAFANKTIGRIRGDRYGIIRQLFTKQNDHYIYGSLCGFIKIEKKMLDLKAMDMVDYEIPQNMFPNPRESEFVFFPELHRLALHAKGKLSLNATVNMLLDIFTQTLGDTSNVKIFIEQSSDGFNKILEAPEIRSLYIEISPSNGDLNEDYIEFFDNDMKEMKAGTMTVHIKPHANSFLVYEKSKILQGMLGMARSNGFARAQITNKDNKREKVETIDYPQQFTIPNVKGKEVNLQLYSSLNEKFRNDQK